MNSLDCKNMEKKTKNLRVLRKNEGDNMGNNSKHKTRKILAATATVTMLATGMIFHRMSLRSKRSSKKFIDIIAK